MSERVSTNPVNRPRMARYIGGYGPYRGIDWEDKPRGRRQDSNAHKQSMTPVKVTPRPLKALEEGVGMRTITRRVMLNDKRKQNVNIGKRSHHAK